MWCLEEWRGSNVNTFDHIVLWIVSQRINEHVAMAICADVDKVDLQCISFDDLIHAVLLVIRSTNLS